jgi:hypothetical protein
MVLKTKRYVKAEAFRQMISKGRGIRKNQKFLKKSLKWYTKMALLRAEYSRYRKRIIASIESNIIAVNPSAAKKNLPFGKGKKE